MRKNIVKTASVLLVAALLFSGAGASLCAFAEDSAQGVSESRNGLIAPRTYEEYLPLQKLYDVALCEQFTAIADGKNVYVYDKKDGVYEKYVHTVNTDASKNDVTKLQFDDAGNLYFLDSSAYLYVLDPDKDDGEEWTVERTGFTCSNFLIHGNDLFFTTPSGAQTQLSVTDLESPDVSSAECILEGLTNDSIAFYNGEIYYADLGKYLNKIDPVTTASTPVTSFDAAIVSMHISGGVFASSDENGVFRTYDLNRLLAEKYPTATFEEAGTHTAVTAYGECFYVANGNVVREYDIKDGEFTDFEICDKSSAFNRLSSATEVSLSRDRLFIADNGNSRISVYNTTTGEFDEAVNADLSPSFLISGGDELLIADSDAATLYDVGAASETYGQKIATFTDFNGDIVGVTQVYGTYYLVTDNNYYYALKLQTANETETWTLSGVKRNSTRYPKLLTSDAYGFLYVVSETGVYRFSETEFLDPTTAGKELCNSLPTNTRKFSVDYEQNFYVLSDNNFYKYTSPSAGGGLYEQTKLDLSTPYVYGENGYVPDLKAFAFGVEENVTYLLCDGNYLVRTDALELPTVRNIPVDGADEAIFSDESADFEVVNTYTGALFVEFDLTKLQGAEFFPYLSYARFDEGVTALKLGESGKYQILAVFDGSEREYHTYLVLKNSCEALDDAAYRVIYSEEERQTGYLTNALPLFKFPYLCELLAAEAELPRDNTVTLIGEIGELDHDYYHVAWTDGNGNVKTGYVQKGYVTLFDGAPPQSEDYLVGPAKSDTDNVWRLGYLLLGFAAICVLTDYLLLRKKKDE